MLAQRTDQFNRPAVVTWSGLLNGSALILFADLLMVPVGLLTVAMLTRWLGPEGYGLFALSASLVAGIEWGLASILSRPTIHGVGHAADWRPVARTFLSWHLILATAVLLVLWIMARPIAGLLGEPTLVTYLVLFACDLPFFLLAQAYRNILTGRGQFAARALTGASRWLARLVLIAIAVELGLSIPAAILGSIGASIVELAVGRWSLGPSWIGRNSRYGGAQAACAASGGVRRQHCLREQDGSVPDQDAGNVGRRSGFLCGCTESHDPSRHFRAGGLGGRTVHAHPDKD